ncbi:MAG: hypothetical protein DI537_47935 [Stutzerimonas stutzeri]|nr:MAG: hypothetical protein DI537_47935 [Stutzerimonas stutzeri]
MSLRLKLKPYEQLHIGATVIANGAAPADLTISGTKMPLLRGGEFIPELAATTPCKKLYLRIQTAYLNEISDPYVEHQIIEDINAIVEAAPSLKRVALGVSSNLVSGDYYKCLIACRGLISEEALLLSCVDHFESLMIGAKH